MVDAFCLGLKGISEEDLCLAGEKFEPIYEQQLFPYSADLVSLMVNSGRETIAISGSPEEAFAPLARFLGISKTFLLQGEKQSGIYTGRTAINMALYGEKLKAIKVVAADDFDPKLSFAFGDSYNDLPVLEAVYNPFVIGSYDNKLLEHATQRNWDIVNSENILEVVNNRLYSLDHS